MTEPAAQVGSTPADNTARGTNFEPKRIAGVRSAVLVLGAYDEQGRVSLAGSAIGVPNSAELC